jgi:hypothetical protein
MTERVAFLMKDLVIFAASFCLLKEDVVRASVLAKPMREQNRTGGQPDLKPRCAFLRRKLTLHVRSGCKHSATGFKIGCEKSFMGWT